MNVHFEVPTGEIDGSNVVFYVSLPYVPGSTAVWLNGVLLERTRDDGWIESNPALGEITLKEAPRPAKDGEDVLQVFFKDNTPGTPDTVIEYLFGVIVGMDDETGLHGTLHAEGLLLGTIGVETELSGILQNEVTSQLYGLLEPMEGFVGTLIGDS